jgi:hypothetical protein
MQALHDALLDIAIENAEEFDLSVSGQTLDGLAEAISEIEVVGDLEENTETQGLKEQIDSATSGLSMDQNGLSAKIGAEQRSTHTESIKCGIKITGKALYYVKFGSIQNSLKKVINSLGGKNVWLLLDEWSEIPLDL